MKKILLLISLFFFNFIFAGKIFANTPGLCENSHYQGTTFHDCSEGLNQPGLSRGNRDLCVPALFVSRAENGVCFGDDNCPGDLTCSIDTNPSTWCSANKDLYQSDPSNTDYWPAGRCVSTIGGYDPTYNCANRGSQCLEFNTSCKDDVKPVDCLTLSSPGQTNDRCWIHPLVDGNGFNDGNTATEVIRGSCATNIVTEQITTECGEIGQRCCLNQGAKEYSTILLDYNCKSGESKNVNYVPNANNGLFDCRCCKNGNCYEEVEDDDDSPTIDTSLCAQAGAMKGSCEDCFGNGKGVWTAIGCIPTEPVGMIKTFIYVGISIGGGVALISFISAGFLYTVSKGDPQKISSAKELMTSSVIGLLFVIFSITILQFIAADLLAIPGFGG